MLLGNGARYPATTRLHMPGNAKDDEGDRHPGISVPPRSGKSATIKILLDLLKPTSGTAEVLGLNPRTKPADLRANVVYVPEQLELGVWLDASWPVAGAPFTIFPELGCSVCESSEAVRAQSRPAAKYAFEGPWASRPSRIGPRASTAAPHSGRANGRTRPGNARRHHGSPHRPSECHTNKRVTLHASRV